jgi:two-component system alkaline phosphatase synthesis response regulator PhoP
MAAKILVVDDEPAIAELIEFNLTKAGYQVEVADNGTDGLELFRRVQPDLVILDVMLPGMDGLEVCRHIRAESKVPVLFLSARKEELDRVLGLEMGGDDYITKPFSPRELVARVKAVLRGREWAADTAPAQAQSEEEVLRFEGLEVNATARRVVAGGREVDLTFTEFELLVTMARRPGRVFTRDELLARVWGDNFFGDMRTVDVHIRHLREKIEPDPSDPVYVRTVRGVGYKFGR